jgi:hypothetical protein
MKLCVGTDNEKATKDAMTEILTTAMDVHLRALSRLNVGMASETPERNVMMGTKQTAMVAHSIVPSTVAVTGDSVLLKRVTTAIP